IDRAAVAAGKVYFDARPELVEAAVVRDRRQLAEEGVVVIFVSAGVESPEIAVVSRGVAVDERALAEEVKRATRAVLSRTTLEERSDVEWLRAEVTLAAKRACRREFEIRPLIVPVVL
ncbi:MAG TPA: hypothetical protein VIZ69_03765, partial [Thermoanaerobaculia bacterium]